jgi:hypothetical protein
MLPRLKTPKSVSFYGANYGYYYSYGYFVVQLNRRVTGME